MVRQGLMLKGPHHFNINLTAGYVTNMNSSQDIKFTIEMTPLFYFGKNFNFMIFITNFVHLFVTRLQ